MTTWTRHKLTHAQLKRLAQIRADIPHGHGTALSALERKGLVERIPDAPYPKTHRLTAAGESALITARAFGW